MIEIPDLTDFRRLQETLALIVEQNVEVLAAIGRVAEQPPMVTRAQASAAAGISVDAIDRLLDRGLITWHKIEGSKRLSRDEVLEAVRHLAQTPRPVLTLTG